MVVKRGKRKIYSPRTDDTVACFIMSVVQAVHPALAAFVAQMAGGIVVAQVILVRAGSGFELRHVADRDVAAETLRTVPVCELRSLAQFTDQDEFRPLKSAPSLRRGWRAVAAGGKEVGVALDQLYPGFVADWFAARGTVLPVTSYREFTARQSGMYRVTAMLDDAGVSRVIRECCAASLCLKCRLWTVAGMEPDTAQEKSIIPCLEPCAVLLETARKAFRNEQDGTK